MLRLQPANLFLLKIEIIRNEVSPKTPVLKRGLYFTWVNAV